VGLLALIVSVVSSLFLFAFGLILIEFPLYPLALTIMALLAALTAVWSSNWLVHDGQHTAPRPVVMTCEVVAIVLAVLLIILAVMNIAGGPAIYVSLPTALLLAITAVFSARNNRTTQTAEPNEGRQALIWLAIAVVAVPLTIFIASLFGWAGA
jgi:hypothetical protein